MHLALAAVWHESGLGVAPAGERPGPFAGAFDVEAFHAQRDHRAVSQPDHLGRHAIGDDVHHDLVECRQRLRPLALQVETTSPRQAGQHIEIIVPDGPSARRCLLHHGQSLLGCPSLHQRDALAQEDEVEQPALWILVFHDAAQPDYPTRRSGGLAGISQVIDQPEDAACGLIGATLLQVASMCAVQQSEGLLIFTKQMSGDGITLEILRRQDVICLRQRGVFLGPVVGKWSHTRHIGFHAASRLLSSLIGAASFP